MCLLEKVSSAIGARQCWGKAAPRLWRSLLQWGHIFESVSCSNDHHNPPPFLSQAHPNHLENQPTQNSSSYGLFSLESTYILITIKLQVIKLLCECTLSDFDIINNYLHIHYKSHFECVGPQSPRFLSPSLPLAPKTKPKACF